MKQLGTALVLFAAAQGAAAAGFFFTGRELLDFCRAAVADASAAKANTCIGYITGIAAAHEVLLDRSAGPPRWCMPDGAHTDHLARIVVSYLQAHPERLQRAAGPLIADAFVQALPCR